MVCPYWYFIHGFKFQKSVCNGCHDLLILCLDISDITIITVKGIDYCCVVHGVFIVALFKSDAINLLENSVLDDRAYI